MKAIIAVLILCSPLLLGGCIVAAAGAGAGAGVAVGESKSPDAQPAKSDTDKPDLDQHQ
jgi:hypothetical protein